MCFGLSLLVGIEFGNGIDGTAGGVDRFQQVGLVPMERGKDMVVGRRTIEVDIHVLFLRHHLGEVRLIVHGVGLGRDADGGVHITITVIGEHRQLSLYIQQLMLIVDRGCQRQRTLDAEGYVQQLLHPVGIRHREFHREVIVRRLRRLGQVWQRGHLRSDIVDETLG